ncbi:hypothetical protein Trisim1_007416 [Trichoderma cf. simile WF8]
MEFDSSEDDEYDDNYYDDFNTEFGTADGKITFDLYQHSNASATTGQGSVKTAFHVKADGAAIFADERSDYAVSVERILWVDGYEESSPSCSGTQRQAMTLAVLKMVFTSSNPNSRIEHARAVLRLKGTEKNGEDEPVVQAWAPFNSLQRSNESVSHREATVNFGMTGDLGYGGSQISLQHIRERRISWSQTEFDEARSKALISKTTHNRNGVEWFLMQNRLQNHGIAPEVWASVLFSRNSSKPYIVSFRIYIRAGTLQDIANKAKNFFGLKPGQTQAYSVTPDINPICNFEGKEILDSIDLNNLGTLRESKSSTKLNINWKPSAGLCEPLEHPLESEHEPRDKIPTREVSSTMQKQERLPVESGEGMRSPRDNEGQSFQGNHIRAPFPGLSNFTESNCMCAQHHGKRDNGPPIMGWSSGIDPGRLAFLEGRVAQSEARIAGQDVAISHLREALAERDARMTKLEQIISSFTHK